MRITPAIFDVFLKCATKCHLRSLGEVGSGNEYAEWVRGRDESYQREAALRLQEAVQETERVVASPATVNLKAAKWRLAVDLLAQTPGRFMDSSHGADAMLTGVEPPAAYPSSCPLPAMRGVGGRRPVVQADETRIVLHSKSAYVWLFATFREVVYFYAESREGDLPQMLLKGFKGVLVSDFYAVYDSLPCSHQKCLVHLMRDHNEAVLDNPCDEGVKGIVTRFASVLKDIVETTDRRGLKRYFLRKHLVDVNRFYRWLSRANCRSGAASKCKERLEKNRESLFTFLTHDGVPWNNNNAEHAIKAFARLRRAITGLSTPEGIEDYLIRLSVCQTCKYMGVEFLDFLRSGEKDIHAFAERRRGRRGRRQTSQPDGLPAGVIPDPGSQP